MSAKTRSPIPADAPTWRSRIVGHRWVAPADLLANPFNARRHLAFQSRAVETSLDTLGWVDEVKVNINTQHVCDGHLRIVLALRRAEQVPVCDLDLTEAEERQMLAWYDRTTELAAWDPVMLALLQEDGVDLSVAWDPDTLAALLPLATPEPGAGGDEFDATPTDGPTRCQPGDLWAIGPHRLLVGDSTDAAQVARLMDGQRAEVCFTSPPYNVGDSERLTGNTHTADTKYVLGSDDALTAAEYLSLLGAFTLAALQHAQYVFVNMQLVAGNKVALLEYLYAYREHLADIAIWDKGHAQPAMAHRVLDSQFEFFLVFSAATRPTRVIGTRDFRGTVPNVYQGPPQRNNEYAEIHAATFPLHLPTWVAETFTNRGGMVLDPFLGSGTTLIAAHRTGRVCYGCELSPQYADVILRRAEAEGIGPILRVQPTVQHGD